MTIHTPRMIWISSQWPENLRRTMHELHARTAVCGMFAGVRETASLAVDTVVLQPAGEGQPVKVKASAVRDSVDAYQWTSEGHTVTIRGTRPRAAAFAVFEIARRLGMRWMTWISEPRVMAQWAEPLPREHRWRATFPVTSMTMHAVMNGFESVDRMRRQCQWMLFHHWNTRWHGSLVADDAVADMAHSFDLDIEFGGHDLRQVMPRDLFDDQPDLFPVIRGRRCRDIGDFAMTNPQAVRMARQNAKTIFQNHRDAQGLHFWYDDVFHGSEDETLPESWSPTRRSAEELRLFSGMHRKTAPGQRLITLAYNGQILPDSAAKFDPQVKILFCPRERCVTHALDDGKSNLAYLDCLKQWIDQVGADRVYFLDYSLDHFLRVSTWNAHPGGEVMLHDVKLLAKLGLGSFHTLTFHEYTDVESLLVMQWLLAAVTRPDAFDPAKLRDEYFTLAFADLAGQARSLFDLYAPLQEAFLCYDTYDGVRRRDMRFAGLLQTKASLRHAARLRGVLKARGGKLAQALRQVKVMHAMTAEQCMLSRMAENMRFSMRQFSMAANMLEGVPYIRGENNTAGGKRAWLAARREIAENTAMLNAVKDHPVHGGTWAGSWLSGWSAQMKRCLQFGDVDERD
ncbi:MAG: DUF4838 domain-containing protein [Phycisphaeraceae bacterium]|nr:DUF4838 domain-containing protein [Phycisphaeraceae bacterium]